MRIVIQRVKGARVDIGGQVIGAIGPGLLVLLGIAKTDTEADASYLVDKLLSLRIFPDEAGKMNLNVLQAGGSLLIVSQFTLYGDCRKGRRPSFDQAAGPELAHMLYNYFVDQARRAPIRVETGVFQASMAVHLVNDGPVTILCDSMWFGVFMIETCGYARAGFLGNPSDGCFGKTISFSFCNFCARVLLYPSARLEIKPSEADLPIFENLYDLYKTTRGRGWLWRYPHYLG